MSGFALHQKGAANFLRLAAPPPKFRCGLILVADSIAAKLDGYQFTLEMKFMIYSPIREAFSASASLETKVPLALIGASITCEARIEPSSLLIM